MAMLVTLVLAACSTTSVKPGEPLAFNIHWAEGEPTLRSTHLREDFAEHTPYGSIEPEVVLMLVPSKGTSEERRQRQELNKVDSEARTFIGVIADLSGMRKDYFSVDVKTAEQLYQGRGKGFHILLLDSSGRLILESDKVLPAEVLRQHFPKGNLHSGGRPPVAPVGSH